MQDIRRFLDAPSTVAPDYIRAEAEHRAKDTRPRAKPQEGRPVPYQGSKRTKRPFFPSRAERRNDWFGRKDTGNTKPDERERTGAFRYHPTFARGRR